MSKFQTSWDYDPDLPSHLEVVSDEPSMTVPDQALSIKELYERYALGRPLDVHEYNGTYEFDLNDPDDFDVDLRHEAPDYDLTDLVELRHENNFKKQVYEEFIEAKRKRESQQEEASELGDSSTRISGESEECE